jgi:hypothetical protein
MVDYALEFNTGRVGRASRDLTILGRQRDGDGQNKLLQINGSKDSSSYIINHMNLIQS